MLGKNNISKMCINILSFLLSMLLVLIALKIWGVAPFGERSILTHDAYIQYIDYFQYLKDLLSGNAHIAFSFSKSLGGSLVALFGYYLSSPFNILVLFFDKSRLDVFITFITVIKVGLCGLSFSWFIQQRFPKLRPELALIASAAYAFTQYNIAFLSNVNWLDGVYMLPLVLLGVWQYISKKRTIPLIASIALTIIFNWYTGYMNCLFAAVYFLYEKLLWEYENTNKLNTGKIIIDSIKFGSCEVLGVLLSSFLFIPVVLGQSRGRVADENILTRQMNGGLLDIIRGCLIGSPDSKIDDTGSMITLFCGVFIFIFCLYFFISKNASLFTKICSGCLIGGMVLSEVSKTLESVWGGFKTIHSYHFRFAYITVFTIIYVACRGFLLWDEREIKKIIAVAASASLLFAGIQFVYRYDEAALAAHVVLLLGYAVLMYLISRNIRYQSIVLKGIVIIFAGELCLNAYFIGSDNYTYDAVEFQDYSEQAQEMVNSIKDYDDSVFFRMEQNITRGNSSFTSNDSMAYGFYGLKHYSSSYDGNTAVFLAALGYCKAEFPTFYNEPLISSDSLLGIKYLASDKAFHGYNLISQLGTYNNKQIYDNNLAFPLAFGAAEDVIAEIDYNSDPFVFQNKIFSSILGRQVEIYEKVDAQRISDGNQIRYEIEDMDTAHMIYGYTSTTMESVPLYINGEFICNYISGWENMGVYQVGYAEQVNIITFGDHENVGEEQISSIFYTLNYDLLKEVSETVIGDQMEIKQFSEVSIEGTYTAQSDGYVMTTIPDDGSWTVYVNGQKVQALQAFGTFLAVPVALGENQISFVYQVRGGNVGFVISLAALLIFIGLGLYRRKRSKREDEVYRNMG